MNSGEDSSDMLAQPAEHVVAYNLPQGVRRTHTVSQTLTLSIVGDRSKDELSLVRSHAQPMASGGDKFIVFEDQQEAVVETDAVWCPMWGIPARESIVGRFARSLDRRHRYSETVPATADQTYSRVAM